MSNKINRRVVLQALATGSSSLALGWSQGTAQSTTEVKVAELTEFAKEFDFKNFDYNGTRSLAVRLPAPKKPEPRILEIDKIYLTAYTLVCTHNGCEPDTPNKDHILVCPCHLSAFNADGSSLGGPATKDLTGIKLEVRGEQVYAVGTF